MKINKFFPFAFIFFFLNSAGLPLGLTYMALLSPFFYWWVVTTRKQEILLPFLSVLLPFIVIQIINGVETKSYVISFLNLITVYVFCQVFYTFLKTCQDIESIFRKLLVINFIFCLIAIPVYFTPFSDIFWINQFLTGGIDNYKRFRLFTYEASYYATLFTPLFFFFLLQIVFRLNKISLWLLIPMIALPYILSFSLGVLTAIIIATGTTYLFYIRSLTVKKRVLNIILLVCICSVSLFIVLINFFPDNTLFIRISNIFSGHDSSGKGRTAEAFFLANKIVNLKNPYWGIGMGQIKIIGADIIRNFYQYDNDYTITIPNATAEMLAVFGWIGVSLRIGLEIFMFFFTKVWTNYYRFALFIFIFIYQLSGSFITSAGEYVIWILAFTTVFKEFDIRKPGKDINTSPDSARYD